VDYTSKHQHDPNLPWGVRSGLLLYSQQQQRKNQMIRHLDSCFVLKDKVSLILLFQAMHSALKITWPAWLTPATISLGKQPKLYNSSLCDVANSKM
jgi:hypothetical protein